MRVIYMMALGQEMPTTVTKVHLTKIISVLCKIMNWVEDEGYSNGNTMDEKEVDIDEDVSIFQKESLKTYYNQYNQKEFKDERNTAKKTVKGQNNEHREK